MRIVCAPEGYKFAVPPGTDLNVTLYGHAGGRGMGAVGATARHTIQRCKLEPAARAWDLLSMQSCSGRAGALSGTGWTPPSRKAMFQISVVRKASWRVRRSRVLLSGGLDSLIGAIDLKGHGRNPYAVSQVSMGDKQKQSFFASSIGGGLAHLQLNHNVDCPGQYERSQRARSIVFLAYGVLAATALKRYHDGGRVTLYVCENGFISINPPLTGARLGSLSTRTTHPFYIRLFQELLDAAGLRVTLENPYQFRTKGEMLSACADQAFLQKYAHTSTSCGRYARNGYKHCGRCLPCLIRRAAFHAWGVKDRTPYVFAKLSRNDKDHARYDDVRSAAMAVAAAKTEGIPTWAGPALSTALLGDTAPYKDVVARSLGELAAFLKTAGVK